MKDKKYIILVAGLFFAGTAYVAAGGCPCEGGTADYQYDCDKDGVPDSCEPCDSCEENNIPSDPNKDCCGGEEYDRTPTSFTPQEWNIQELANMYNGVKQTLSSIGPCGSSGGGAPSIGVKLAFFKDCCGGKVTDLKEYTGFVSWNLGSYQCDWPIIGIPYTASANITAGVGLNVSIDGSKKESCGGSGANCFSGDGALTFSGGLSATLAANVIRISATLQPQTHVGFKYCDPGGLSGDINLVSIYVVGEATVLGGFKKEISYQLM